CALPCQAAGSPHAGQVTARSGWRRGASSAVGMAGDRRVVHLARILRGPAKRVNSGTWRSREPRFSLTPIDGVASRCADLSTQGLHPTTRSHPAIPRSLLWIAPLLLPGLVLGGLAAAPDALAAAPPQGQHSGGGEASLIVPDLGQVPVGGMNGRSLLMVGLLVCVLGLLFGIVIFKQLQGLPVHASMREISELIYETCKTYLITQGKFL